MEGPKMTFAFMTGTRTHQLVASLFLSFSKMAQFYYDGTVHLFNFGFFLNLIFAKHSKSTFLGHILHPLPINEQHETPDGFGDGENASVADAALVPPPPPYIEATSAATVPGLATG